MHHWTNFTLDGWMGYWMAMTMTSIREKEGDTHRTTRDVYISNRNSRCSRSRPVLRLLRSHSAGQCRAVSQSAQPHHNIDEQWVLQFRYCRIIPLSVRHHHSNRFPRIIIIHDKRRRWEKVRAGRRWWWSSCVHPIPDPLHQRRMEIMRFFCRQM